MTHSDAHSEPQSKRTRKARTRRQPQTPEIPLPKLNGNPNGRPSSFTQNAADRICERLMNGESLRNVCRDPEMPCEAAVLKWLNERSEFAGQYARAKAISMERWSEEILDISVNEPDVNRARLQIDTRKWLMSKLAPKRYGDKLTVGGDADGPVRLVCEWKAPALAALTKPEDESD